MTKENKGKSEDFFGFGEIYGSPWAYDEGFKITTVRPSSVVNEMMQKSLIPDKSKVLDLGCGKNARNSVFLSQSHKCHIDAFDLEPPDFPDDLSSRALERIHFKQGSVLEFDYGKSVYQAAILARLIQYISPQELELLFSKVGEALIPKGILALSYTAQGGILNKSKVYEINVFAHPIEKVQEMLEQRNFSVISLQRGASKSTHVPHSGEKAVTFDIIAQKDL